MDQKPILFELCFVRKKFYRKKGILGIFFFDEYNDYYYNCNSEINKFSKYYENKLSHTKDYAFTSFGNMICISIRQNNSKIFNILEDVL